MVKKYLVTGVIIDVNDVARRFKLEVSVKSVNQIERMVRKVYRLHRYDLIRDISFEEPTS